MLVYRWPATPRPTTSAGSAGCRICCSPPGCLSDEQRRSGNATTRGGAVPADFDLVAPRADALMESLRATGYSLPDAVSDLIDNSITAGASDIRLDFQWAGADS